ncbi:hypothetical protein lerEdw1_020135 [Lerista edwardsae]|nr:hypothetical protein lerEdw1_020135 [Lerista edwardsae]
MPALSSAEAASDANPLPEPGSDGEKGVLTVALVKSIQYVCMYTSRKRQIESKIALYGTAAMKKRRKLPANLDNKICLDHEKASSDNVLVADSVQEASLDLVGATGANKFACSKELPPSPDQRKLLSSLEYNKNLLRYLNDDRQKQPSFCDLLIIVEGKEFSAHKVVVAVGSSYFHAYLSKNPSTDVVTLDHVTHSVFRHLLEFLYTSEFFVYKNEIPLVLEAAKFLDIIDAVKLLNSENISSSQPEEKTENPPQIDTISELIPKATSTHQCALCSRNFCYKKSLENHLSRAHKSLTWKKEHGLKMVEKSDISTRRSTRNRKCPAKFAPSDNESGDASDSNLDKVTSGKENNESEESEDSGSEYNTDEDRQDEETSGDDTESGEESEKEQDEGSPEPDGLAGDISKGTLSAYIPVVIQNSSKKCLQCPKCHKIFDRAGPFPCDICGRQFNDTGNLKRHIECTHGGKRKWTCFICGKSVRERLHLRVHHDDKRYECEECGKTFIRHDHLTKHKKIHSGEKAHQCEECGKCFGRRDHLTVHYKSVHLGEKVWQKYKATFHQCEVCKKIFKGKSSLDMHFRTHSGEKPYKCQICNQSFRIKKTLTKHMVIHSDARPFNCQYCNATFKRKDKLKYHTDHVHGGKSTEESLSPPPMEEKNTSLPTQCTPDDKAFQSESKPFMEQSKAYQAETKTMLQNVSTPDACVPVTLVPVRMRETQSDLVQHTSSLTSSPHNLLPPQPPPTDYQQATDLAFLEKYTLTPQPANIIHPVRPEQMLDPREQSYLGTLLGLDTAPSVQNISSNEHS